MKIIKLGEKITAANDREAEALRQRLKEKGIHTEGRSPKKGDEYVEIRIAVPRNISPEAQKKLKEYAALAGERVEL